MRARVIRHVPVISAARFGVLMIAVSSCATPRPTAPVTQEQVALNPYDSKDDRPAILLTAKLAGRLGSNGRCIIVGAEGAVVTPLWPEGTEVMRRGSETVLVLPGGRGTAVVGEKVSLGGGSLPASQRERLPEWVKRHCPELYFAVSFVGD